ncbi:MAG: hypothetical protein HXY23_15350 [Parvularculaceae bacterium]|nr:hypothetical protein [Parvularculaceae bacterium]
MWGLQIAVAASLAVAALAVAGCAPAGSSPALRAVDDRFLPYREVMTETRHVVDVDTSVAITLSARIPRDAGASAYVLMLDVTYRSAGRALRHYDSARDASAETLPLRAVSRESLGCERSDACTRRERLEILLPASHIEATPRGSYDVKIFARNGPSLVVALQPQTLTHLVARVRTERAAPARTAAQAQQR